MYLVLQATDEAGNPGGFLQPVFEWLGFGDLAEGWRYATVAVAGLIVLWAVVRALVAFKRAVDNRVNVSSAMPLGEPKPPDFIARDGDAPRPPDFVKRG